MGVKRLAVARWELGQAQPRKPHRQVYFHFLKRLAEKYPHVAQEEPQEPVPAGALRSLAGMPTPASGSRGSG
ncbi:hypothetical protein [Streptomyces triculaminicus]|uniref:hypothetical protein n=1 Tax=Streptomyces triculaminicus TaxID=2816232 RepID=UPI0037D219A0